MAKRRHSDDEPSSFNKEEDLSHSCNDSISESEESNIATKDDKGKERLEESEGNQTGFELLSCSYTIIFARRILR